MAVGSRRRGLAAGASAIAAAALALAMAGRGCQADDETPEGAVRAFAAAAHAGDREAVYELLGPATRERLAHEAARATEIAGGERRFRPREMVSVAEPGVTRPSPQGFERRSLEGNTAVVEIIGQDGERTPIKVVREGGLWRVELE